MPLSDDQRAMLRLLAQREQGYEDMAALMGVSVEELRARVKDALTELEKEGKEAPALPPEPAAPQAAPEAPKEEPLAPEPPKPAAPPPTAAPSPERSATPPAGQAPPPKQPKRGDSLLSSTGARIGAGAVAAAVVVVVVLLLVLGGGGDSDSTTGTTTVNNTEAPNGNAVAKVIKSTEGESGGREVTRAVLDGSDGQEDQGVVVFGRLKNKLALYIVAEGVEALPRGESYVVWIAASADKMLPLPISPVVENGKIAERVQVPTELLAYLADGTFDEIAITRASVSKLNTALNQATKAKEEVGYTGTEVMRGKITGPIVGAAKRIEEEQGNGGK